MPPKHHHRGRGARAGRVAARAGRQEAQQERKAERLEHLAERAEARGNTRRANRLERGVAKAERKADKAHNREQMARQVQRQEQTRIIRDPFHVAPARAPVQKTVTTRTTPFGGTTTTTTTRVGGRTTTTTTRRYHRGYYNASNPWCRTVVRRRPTTVRYRYDVGIPIGMAIGAAMVIRASDGTYRCAHEDDPAPCSRGHDVVALDEVAEITLRTQDGHTETAYADSYCRTCGQHFFVKYSETAEPTPAAPPPTNTVVIVRESAPPAAPQGYSANMYPGQAPPPQAPPSASPYGAPPAATYGAPPPSSNPYGAPPADNPYGAPATPATYGSPYGAPPPADNNASPYGAPPPSAESAKAAEAYGTPYGTSPYGSAPPASAPGEVVYPDLPPSYSGPEATIESKPTSDDLANLSPATRVTDGATVVLKSLSSGRLVHHHNSALCACAGKVNARSTWHVSMPTPSTARFENDAHSGKHIRIKKDGSLDQMGGKGGMSLFNLEDAGNGFFMLKSNHFASSPGYYVGFDANGAPISPESVTASEVAMFTVHAV